MKVMMMGWAGLGLSGERGLEEEREEREGVRRYGLRQSVKTKGKKRKFVRGYY